MKNTSIILGTGMLCLLFIIRADAQNSDDTKVATHSNNLSITARSLPIPKQQHQISKLVTMKATNKEAPVYCTQSIRINASPEKVWSVMTGIDQWANWQTDIAKPKLNGPLTPSSTFDWKTGGAKIHSTLHTVNPYEQFGWTGKTFGMFAIHNWTLRENGGMVDVEVEESLQGFFASVLKKSFNRNLERDMKNWLERLKTESERTPDTVLR